MARLHHPTLAVFPEFFTRYNLGPDSGIVLDRDESFIMGRVMQRLFYDALVYYVPRAVGHMGSDGTILSPLDAGFIQYLLPRQGNRLVYTYIYMFVSRYKFLCDF